MSNSIRKQLLKAGMLAKAAHDGVYASDHYQNERENLGIQFRG